MAFPAERRWAARAVTIGLWIPVALLAAGGWSRRWMSDDGFIYLRVVKQVLAGNGPVVNVGERVEAATGPLWVAMLAVAGLLSPVPLEWLAVTLGLALSVAGLAFGVAAARRLWATDSLVLPLGAIVFAAVPVARDFATSGLESGLTFAWLGLSFWWLTGRTSQPSMLLALAAFAGLGPLIRPDLAVFSAAFLAALVAGRSWRQAGAIVAASLAVPVAYQVFRMGYFASPVPNPAIAKESTLAYWDRGLAYLGDFVTTFGLFLPLAVLLAGWGRALSTRGRPLVPLVVVAAVVHSVYVTRVGGDFMRGRLLLPALFALLLPVMAVPVERARSWWPTAALVSWAAIVMLTGGRGAVGLYDVFDERAFYVVATGHANPVEVGDFARAIRLAAPSVHFDGRVWSELPAGADDGDDLAIVASMVGAISYQAPTSAWIVDPLGIVDPVGSRLALRTRGRAGHEKWAGPGWIEARVTRDEADRCPAAAPLVEAIRSPLTPSRFWRNARDSVSLMRLRLPATPEACPDRR